jgi:hypothetical protein
VPDPALRPMVRNAPPYVRFRAYSELMLGSGHTAIRSPERKLRGDRSWNQPFLWINARGRFSSLNAVTSAQGSG